MKPTRVLAAALTAAAIAAGGAAHAQDLGPLAGILFDQVDANRDGAIDKGEIQVFRGRTFDRYDENRDGFVTVQEFERAQARQQERRAGRLARIAELRARMPTPSERLAEADKDGDGRISRAEFVNGANHWFDALAKGGSTLSKSQFAAFLEGAR